MKEYVEDNIYQQYLVDGAVLRCNQAMTDDVVFTEWGEKVILEHKADEVCNIILNVPETNLYCIFFAAAIFCLVPRIHMLFANMFYVFDFGSADIIIIGFSQEHNSQKEIINFI